MLYISLNLIFEFHQYKAGLVGIASAFLFALGVAVECAKAKR